MTKPIILLGAGGHAKVLISVMQRLNLPVLGLVDPQMIVGGDYCGIKVLGADDVVLDHDPQAIELVNGVGSLPNDGAIRERLFERFAEQGYHFKTLIDPSAVVVDSGGLAAGVQVMAGAVVQIGTQIAYNCIVNSGAVIEHDCQLARHVHVAPGATLCGGVVVAEHSHIGAGAVVIQNQQIGKNCVVAAGCVVTRSLADGQIIYPARPQLKDRL